MKPSRNRNVGIERGTAALDVFWDWAVTWRGGSVLWAMTNTIVAQAAAPDDLLSWGLTLAGVTVPFGVGWVWNRQWADAVRRQNDFLKQQDEQLRAELVEERAEKFKVYEDNDGLRRLVAQFEAEAILAKGERQRLERDLTETQSKLVDTTERLSRLEQVVQLRRSEVPHTGSDRRKRRVELEGEPNGPQSE